MCVCSVVVHGLMLRGCVCVCAVVFVCCCNVVVCVVCDLLCDVVCDGVWIV